MIPERLIARYAETALPVFMNSPETVKKLSVLFDEEPLLLRVLMAPMVSESKKLQLLEISFGKVPEIKALLTLLMQHRRLAALPEILSRCQEKLQGSKGRLTLAEGLDSKTESELIAQFKKAYGNMPLVTEVDPNLIGGFTLELKNRLLDASIKGSLCRIKKQLERGTCA